MNSHRLFVYLFTHGYEMKEESSYEFKSRESCVSCVKGITGKRLRAMPCLVVEYALRRAVGFNYH